MDLDYIQKYQFSAIGGSGGLPFMLDAPLITSTLTGGSLGMDLHLAIPGGLVYRHCIHEINSVEKDPWAIGVREDFDSLLDLISVPSSSSVKKNKTKRSNKKSNNLSR